MSFVDTARRVRELGGLPFAAHPFDMLAHGVGARRLHRIQQEHPGLLAGIEVINGSLLTPVGNIRAERLRWELGLPGIGNSDAHLLADIGAGYTLFAGASAAELRAALEAGHVTPALRARDPGFYRRALARFALRAGLGLADLLEEGEEPSIRLGRLRL